MKAAVILLVAGMLGGGAGGFALHHALDARSNATEAAPATALDRAVDFVRTEARHLANTSDSNAVAFRYYAAISALSYVQTNLSTARYSAAKASGTPIATPLTPEQCLDQSIGLCGNHFEAFRDILFRLGIETRPVQVFWSHKGTTNNHIFAEVMWNESWHMFDISWGFVPQGEKPFDVLSFADVRAGKKPFTAAVNENNIWYRMASQIYDVFEYQKASDLSTITNNGGTIQLPANSTAGKTTYDLANLIPYIGRIPREQTGPSLKYNIRTPNNLKAIEISFKPGQCETGTLIADNKSYLISAEKIIVPVTDDDVDLRVRSDKTVCYIKIESIRGIM